MTMGISKVESENTCGVGGGVLGVTNVNEVDTAGNFNGCGNVDGKLGSGDSSCEIVDDGVTDKGEKISECPGSETGCIVLGSADAKDEEVKTEQVIMRICEVEKVNGDEIMMVGITDLDSGNVIDSDGSLIPTESSQAMVFESESTPKPLEDSKSLIPTESSQAMVFESESTPKPLEDSKSLIPTESSQAMVFESESTPKPLEDSKSQVMISDAFEDKLDLTELGESQVSVSVTEDGEAELSDIVGENLESKEQVSGVTKTVEDSGFTDDAVGNGEVEVTVVDSLDSTGKLIDSEGCEVLVEGSEFCENQKAEGTVIVAMMSEAIQVMANDNKEELDLTELGEGQVSLMEDGEPQLSDTVTENVESKEQVRGDPEVMIEDTEILEVESKEQVRDDPEVIIEDTEIIEFDLKLQDLNKENAEIIDDNKESQIVVMDSADDDAAQPANIVEQPLETDAFNDKMTNEGSEFCENQKAEGTVIVAMMSEAGDNKEELDLTELGEAQVSLMEDGEPQLSDIVTENVESKEQVRDDPEVNVTDDRDLNLKDLQEIKRDAKVIHEEVKDMDGVVHISSSESSSEVIDAQTKEADVPQYNLISVPRFEDEKINEQIKNAQLQLDEKTKCRDAIRAEIQAKKTTMKAHDEAFKAARQLVRSKRQEIDSIQCVINKIKNANTVEDIDSRILQLCLKDEKKFIYEIKQLKNLRDQLASSIVSDEIEQALIQERLNNLSKELKSLKDDVSKAEVAALTIRKICEVEKEMVKELQAQFQAANEVRQEAYGHLNSLKTCLYEKNKPISVVSTTVEEQEKKVSYDQTLEIINHMKEEVKNEIMDHEEEIECKLKEERLSEEKSKAMKKQNLEKSEMQDQKEVEQKEKARRKRSRKRTGGSSRVDDENIAKEAEKTDGEPQECPQPPPQAVALAELDKEQGQQWWRKMSTITTVLILIFFIFIIGFL